MRPTQNLPVVIFALSASIISVSATEDQCINPLSGKTSQRCYCRHNPCMYLQRSDNEGCRVDNCGGCHPVFPGERGPYVKEDSKKCENVPLKLCPKSKKLVGPNPYKHCEYWECPEDEHEIPEECTTPCGDRGTIVNCLIDPCTVAVPPDDLKGTDFLCESNYCGGCHAVFVTKDGEKVYQGCKGEKGEKGNENGSKGSKGEKEYKGTKGEKVYKGDGNEGTDTMFCPTDDVKQCDDGSFVSRNPDRGCEFDPCPSERVSPVNKGEKEYRGNKGEKEFNGKKGEKGQKSQGGSVVGKGEIGKDNENGSKGKKEDPSYEMAKHSKFAISGDDSSETSSEEPSPEYLAHDPGERSSHEESTNDRLLRKHLQSIRGSHPRKH